MLKYGIYCSFFGADAVLACVASPKGYRFYSVRHCLPFVVESMNGTN